MPQKKQRTRFSHHEREKTPAANTALKNVRRESIKLSQSATQKKKKCQTPPGHVVEHGCDSTTSAPDGGNKQTNKKKANDKLRHAITSERKTTQQQKYGGRYSTKTPQSVLPSLHENVRGEGEIDVATDITTYHAEIRGDEDKKRHIRPEDPTTENGAAQAFLFFSSLERATGLNDARTHRATINVSRVWHFSSFPKGWGGEVSTSGGGFQEGDPGDTNEGNGPARRGLWMTLQCEEEEVVAATTVNTTYREREKNNLRFE